MLHNPFEKVGVSVVIGSFNRLPFLKLTVDNLREELSFLDCPSEIIVVDGGSNDGTLEWLVKQKDLIVIVQHNRGFWNDKPIVRRSWGYFMNLAFKATQYRYVAMFSDDCLLVPGALKAGMAHFDSERTVNPKVAAVAFYWRNWPEQINYWVGLTLGRKLFVNHGMYLREALESIGFIDEINYHFYHADGDLCLRLWDAGWECIDCRTSFVEHHSHANVVVRQSNFERQAEDWRYYLDRWSHLNSPEEPDYEGSWIYLEYSDPFEIAKKFEQLSIQDNSGVTHDERKCSNGVASMPSTIKKQHNYLNKIKADMRRKFNFFNSNRR